MSPWGAALHLGWVPGGCPPPWPSAPPPSPAAGVPQHQRALQRGAAAQLPVYKHSGVSSGRCPVAPIPWASATLRTPAGFWWHPEDHAHLPEDALAAGRAGLQSFRLSPESHVSTHRHLAHLPKAFSPSCPMAHHASPGGASPGSLCHGVWLALCHSWACGDKGTG